jgi:GNS1/SUR4 family
VHELQEYQRTSSLEFFFCTPPDAEPSGRLYFWSYVYYLSKFYEFVDTLFLALRRKPTSFLHVFHHALVVVMAWLWVDQRQTLQWGGLLTNTAVHVVMYFYYYLATQGQSPWWKRYITTFQIVQFGSRCASAATVAPVMPAPLWSLVHNMTPASWRGANTAPREVQSLLSRRCSCVANARATHEFF